MQAEVAVAQFDGAGGDSLVIIIIFSDMNREIYTLIPASIYV